jgi:hypothetical protein
VEVEQSGMGSGMELPPQMRGKWIRNLASSFPKCGGIAPELPQTAEESGTRAGRAQMEKDDGSSPAAKAPEN